MLGEAVGPGESSFGPPGLQLLVLVMSGSFLSAQEDAMWGFLYKLNHCFGLPTAWNITTSLYCSPLAWDGFSVICCWDSASFWVITGTKNTVSCLLWNEPAGLWEKETLCRRHCPRVEEDEGYFITDMKRSECGRFSISPRLHGRWNL